jgi:hypothetical protein
MKWNPWVHVVFFERYMSWLYACNMPAHMGETPEQVGNFILKKLRLSFNDNCHSEK